jgi:AraC-like DNA-binding protein
MSRQEAKHEAQRIRTSREELVERMARAIPEDGVSEVFPGFFLGRASQPTERLHSVFKPAFCVIVEDIARELGMSISGFHHHFKSVTAMSPLQFQKQIRLQEARRLMLGEDLDAASAGFRVGYEDPSYFSRDYKKLFGAPPQRDIARLRGALELH